MIQKLLTSYIKSFEGLSKEIWLLAFVTLINRAGTMVILFLAVYLTQELGFTKTQAGYILSAWGIGSLLGTYLGGWLTDRFGYYRVMLWSLLGAGIGFIVMQWVTTFWPLAILLVVVITIADTFRPANLVAISVYSKPENRTRSLALIRLAINLGFVVGPSIGGFLAFYFGYSFLFYLDGFTCLAGLFSFWLLLEERDRPKKQEKSIDKSAIRKPYQDAPYMRMLLGNFLFSIAFFQLFSTVPVYFREDLGYTENIIGLILGANGLLIFLIEMPIVHRYEKTKDVLRLVEVGMVLVGLSYAVLYLPGLAAILAGTVVLITIGEILVLPFGNSYALERSETAVEGQYMAYYGMSFSLSHIFAPALGLYIAEQWGFDHLWVVLVGFIVLAIAFTEWSRRTS